MRANSRAVYSFLPSVMASKSERLPLLLFSRTFNKELLVMFKFPVKNLCVEYRICVKALSVGYRIFIKDLHSFFMTELLGWNKTNLTFFLARSCLVRSR